MKSLFSSLTKDKPYLFFLLSVIFLSALISILIGTIFIEAYPAVSKVGVLDFIFGTKWGDTLGVYGSWIFIMGTFFMTIVTMCMAVPLGIFTAIYLAEFSSPKVSSLMKSSIELLVGIPSVVYGILGLFVLKDFLSAYITPVISGTLGAVVPLFRVSPNSDGTGIFLASVVLTIMILPTIISISYDAMRSVSRELREGSLALGATHWETIEKIIIPKALPGIIAGITLGMMRALGETMAIVMLLGNAMNVPGSIFDNGYAITSKILNDITYTYGMYPEATSALFGLAALLFVIEAIFLLAMKIICRGYSIR